MKNMIKVQKIEKILRQNIVKTYIDNPQDMRQSLKWLDQELREMSNDEIIERYEYLLAYDEELEENGEVFDVIRYGKKYIIIISLYENGKRLDARNKKIKNYYRKNFVYNKDTKHFERTIIF